MVHGPVSVGSFGGKRVIDVSAEVAKRVQSLRVGLQADHVIVFLPAQICLEMKNRNKWRISFNRSIPGFAKKLIVKG